MNNIKARKKDVLGDRLIAGCLEADAIYGDNIDVVKASKLKFPKGTSEDIKKLVRYFKFERLKFKPSKSYLDIAEAWDLYNSYPDKGSPRWLVEALLLGGCSNRATANYCGLRTKTIYYYKRFFFDIEAPGNRKQLAVKADAMANHYKSTDVDNWGLKLEVLANGLDWFIRTRVEKCPTKEDVKKMKSLLSKRVHLARMQTSLLISNIDNYKRLDFVNMTETLGVTYSHIQKDIAQEAKTGGAVEGGTADVMIAAVKMAMCSAGVDPTDTKISVFDEDQAAEELLPI